MAQDLGGAGDDEGDAEDHRSKRHDGGQRTREAELAPDVERQCRLRAGEEEDDDELVERNQEGEHESRKHGRQAERQHDTPERRPVGGAEVQCCFADRLRNGGETAARYSGVDTKAIKFKVLVISSSAAALAGMLYAGRLQSGRFQLGEGDELSVIAAAVLGGTSLFGGRGTVIGTIVGALMIGLINNGLILMGLEFSQQLIARGAIIILAVALSQKRA